MVQSGCLTTKPMFQATAATAKSLQSCLTLCDPIDGSPPGSPIPGILQARTLEWAAISFSKVWKGKVKVKPLSPVRLLATSCTAAYQAPPSMGFSRQEYWSGVPLPSPIFQARSMKKGCRERKFKTSADSAVFRSFPRAPPSGFPFVSLAAIADQGGGEM